MQTHGACDVLAACLSREAGGARFDRRDDGRRGAPVAERVKVFIAVNIMFPSLDALFEIRTPFHTGRSLAAVSVRVVPRAQELLVKRTFFSRSKFMKLFGAALKLNERRGAVAEKIVLNLFRLTKMLYFFVRVKRELPAMDTLANALAPFKACRFFAAVFVRVAPCFQMTIHFGVRI